jgi:acetyltransferase
MGDESMQASRNLFREHGIPTYATPEAAVEAFAAAAAYRANQELLLQVPQALGKRAEPDREGAQLIIQNALAQKRRVLDLVESKALLAAFGIPVVRSIPAHEPNEALAIAEEFGFPVAMKIHSPDISHKTEVDGVRLGIGSGRDVQTAFRQLVETAQARRPDAKINGVLIEPMWQSRAGRELMLGVINDEVFGPVISVGLGGTMVEVLRDRAIGLPPLNRFLAKRMIAGTRASRFLDEFRGRPAANVLGHHGRAARVPGRGAWLPAEGRPARIRHAYRRTHDHLDFRSPGGAQCAPEHSKTGRYLPPI